MTTRTETYAHKTTDIEWVYQKRYEHGIDHIGFTNYQIYQPASVFRDETLCCSITYLDDVPWLVSTAIVRAEFNTMVRVANRYTINPEYEHQLELGKGYDGIRLDCIDQIDQQIEFCKKLGYNDFFFSRHENIEGSPNSALIASKAQEYSQNEWNYDGLKYLVCGNPAEPRCWQNAIVSGVNRLTAHFV